MVLGCCCLLVEWIQIDPEIVAENCSGGIWNSKTIIDSDVASLERTWSEWARWRANQIRNTNLKIWKLSKRTGNSTVPIDRVDGARCAAYALLRSSNNRMRNYCELREWQERDANRTDNKFILQLSTTSYSHRSFISFDNRFYCFDILCCLE